ncbi:MAG TPA: hypothetical protein VII49_13240 [Rhizomicrobium sp.]
MLNTEVATFSLQTEIGLVRTINNAGVASAAVLTDSVYWKLGTKVWTQDAKPALVDGYTLQMVKEVLAAAAATPAASFHSVDAAMEWLTKP